jgi:CBS domain-containing protein
LNESDTLGKALQILHDNNILSAPVIHHAMFAEADGTLQETCPVELPMHSSRVVGMIDLLDITGFVLHEWEHQTLDLPWTKDPIESRKQLFDTPLKCILNFSCVDSALTISDTASVAQLIKTLADIRGIQRRHRLLVVDNEDRVHHIISQSDLIRWIYSKANHLPDGLEMKTVKELGLVKSCIMASVESSCYEAADILYRNRVSGLAIVNSKGELTTNFSLSDLRGITLDSYSYFHNSIMDFLLRGTDSGLADPITCTESSSLLEVLLQLTANGVHRVYVVHPISQKPVGVITLTDIIRLLNMHLEA